MLINALKVMINNSLKKSICVKKINILTVFFFFFYIKIVLKLFYNGLLTITLMTPVSMSHDPSFYRKIIRYSWSTINAYSLLSHE